MKAFRTAVLAVAGLAACRTGQAQSLFRPMPAQQVMAPTPGTSALMLRDVSLMAVAPPEPRVYQEHDLVQIIINESSIQKYEQSLDTEKKYDADLTVGHLPSLRHLLEAQLKSGDTDPLLNPNASANNKYNGDGTYERKDQFTTRISATVLEVKPNGTLVLEAKSVRQADTETVSLVVAGVCRPEDITAQNTIQSTQLANLSIKVENTGDVKNAAQKGIITRVLDTLFAF